MEEAAAKPPLDSALAHPTISLVMPVLNAMEYLPRTLPALVAAAGQYGGVELILVDNGSSDGSYEFLHSQLAGRARILQSPGVTVAQLRNQGAALATGQLLSFLDADCLVAPDYFLDAVEIFHSIPADAAGCEYELPADAGWLEATWHHINWRAGDAYVSFLWAGNFFIRRSVFQQAGGFQESLVTGEDAELGIRLTARGCKFYRSEKIAAVHLGNAKTVAAFLRKQAWHGLGMFGSVHVSWRDKALLMVLADLALTAAGITALLCPGVPWRLRLGSFLTALLLVPGATVAYRCLRKRQLYRPVRSVLLYRLYFTARIYALFKIACLRLLTKPARASA